MRTAGFISNKFFHMQRRHHSVPYLFCLLALALAGLWLGLRSRAEVKNAPPPPAQTAPQSQSSPPNPAQAAPSPDPYLMDGSAGPCSVELSVTDAAGKPISSALISVHVAYGFGGFHKLDMSVYSGPEGKAKFIGLPIKVKNPPLEFHASKDKLVGVATMNPATECQAKHDIVMDVAKPAAGK
jgi:hypothetical protein